MNNNKQPILSSLVKSFDSKAIENNLRKLLKKQEQKNQNYLKAGFRGTGQTNLKAVKENKNFAIQLPPPNVTGTLHMGHAFNQTIMDALTRYHRMSGFNTLWQPGTDHAGIATQIVVERQLKNQAKDELGREKFIEKIWEWKKNSGNNISEQMKRLGASVDWSREYFTMDENLSEIVIETFVKLYEQGLIYRGKRLVNWDPILQTAVSDLEVISEEQDGFLWLIAYPLANKNKNLVIATTRPETMLGDVAVMVHPEDERYKHLIGQKVILPLCDREIPIIADSYVDKDFGTGVVKVTPAHDNNDYQVGQRHNLEQITILDLTAKINEKAPKKYQGLDRFEARKIILEDLKNQNLLIETKKHKLTIPICERTGQIIEPMLTNQWFVAMNKIGKNCKKSLAELGLEAVKNKEIKFVPENWINTYNQWLNNLQDWCISRQLWWGHQIPAWYDEEGNIYVAKNEAEAQNQAGNKKLTRDPDVLDTWYSSALVPFSTLDWLKKDKSADHEFNLYLPSTVLVTGYDIIFFWIARMIMITKHFTNKIPFKNVYIHGLVRDSQGKKMSKSEGNVLDPVDLIDGINLDKLLIKRTSGLRRPENAPQVKKQTEKEFPNGIPAYGADALRFTFASLASLGRSINFDSKRCEGYRNFCNKLWNATRFVLMQCESFNCEKSEIDLSFYDKWIISRLQKVEEEVNKNFNQFRLDLVAQNIYDFIWNEFCDWYLEIAKIQIQNGDKNIQQNTRFTLINVLETILRLSHPIIPFITEELWQKIKPLIDNEKVNFYSIAIANYPKYQIEKIDEKAENYFQKLKSIVEICRNLRGEMKISPAVKLPLLVYCKNQENKNFLNENLNILKSLIKLSEIKFINNENEFNNLTKTNPINLFEDIKLALFIEIDKESETQRLTKEIEKLEKEINKSKIKLNNESFVKKAPKNILEQEKNRLSEFNSKLIKIKEQLNKLN